jgi:hypothetical protein
VQTTYWSNNCQATFNHVQIVVTLRRQDATTTTGSLGARMCGMRVYKVRDETILSP